MLLDSGPAQYRLFDESPSSVQPFSSQLLKWVGNKQRVAHQIVALLPGRFERYLEPFIGSGAVMATLAPPRGLGSDCFRPLIDIWQTLTRSPGSLKCWYAERWQRMMRGDKVQEYERLRAEYNARPNGADLLFLCRTCYGGIMRFRKADGHISTPCGAHSPIPPEKFARRVDEWHARLSRVEFYHMEYEEAMMTAQPGDVVYCDPPYSYSQAILYGAQDFSLERLFVVIDSCRRRDVNVALSIDGTKKTGDFVCDVNIPKGLFKREFLLNCGRSMLKRFQMAGQSLENEVVHDRLLLTY